MQFGMIKLKNLYRTIKEIHSNPIAPPMIPPRRSDLFRQFRNEYEQLIRNVKGNRAVYIWIARTNDTTCECIYVGESRKNADGLRGRFKDEFNKWYHIFWMTAFKSDKYENEVIRMYNTPSKDYSVEVQNVSLKKGVTHFLYCTDIPNGVDAKRVQDDLIQLFNNPRGNAKDIREMPLPESELLQVSKDIFAEFKKLAQQAEPYDI